MALCYLLRLSATRARCGGILLNKCGLEWPELSSVGPRILPRPSSVLCRVLSSAPSSKDGSQPSPRSLSRDRLITVPNALCVSRIVLAPYVAHLESERLHAIKHINICKFISQGDFKWALGIFGYAALTDCLDGYIARKVPGQASMLGSFLDPLADKILVMALFFSLTYANVIPAALTSLVVSRDCLLIFAGFYIRYMSVEPPFTLNKYFDMSLPSAQVRPTTISKINTLVQLSLLATAMAAPIWGFQDHRAFYGLCGFTGLTTFLSAVSYAFQRDTYSFKYRAYDHQLKKKLAAFLVFIMFNAGFIYYFPSQKRMESSQENK